MMNRTIDPDFSAVLRRALVERVDAPGRHGSRRRVVIGGGAFCAAVAVLAGGITTASGPGVPDAPARAPILIDGTGPGKAALPPAPAGAVYLRVELVCFDATRCETPGGGVRSPGQPATLWQRDALPITADPDPKNAQSLDPLDVSAGLPITTDRESTWRLYATYVERLNPRSARLKDGRMIGIPDNASFPPPSLVPIEADNGRPGYVDFEDLLGLTNGAVSDELAVYDQDGTTVIGEVSVG